MLSCKRWVIILYKFGLFIKKNELGIQKITTAYQMDLNPSKWNLHGKKHPSKS